MRELDEQPSPGTRSPARLAKVTHNLLRQYIGYVYEYDVQGNTVLKRPRLTATANEEGVLTFAYDADNRLTTAIRTFPNSRVVARYSYDAFGRRIAKRVDEQRWGSSEEPPPVGQAHTGKLTLFVWDGDVMVQEVVDDRTVTYVYEPDSFVPLARVESSRDVTTFANSAICIAPITETHCLLTGSNADPHVNTSGTCWDPIAMRQFQERRNHVLPGAVAFSISDRVLHYQCDHLGMPLELLDADSVVVWAARRCVWGRVFRQLSNKVEQPLGFQGQYCDPETGLHYNRYRYYDPNKARFLTQDPIRLGGGINIYQYAPNSTGWLDPLGLARIKGITPNNKGTRTTIEGGKGMTEPVIGYSTRAGGEGASHPVIRDLYDSVPKVEQSEFNGDCGEADALSKIAKAHDIKDVEQLRAITTGASALTLRNDGKSLLCCSSCKHVTERLNIKDKLRE